MIKTISSYILGFFLAALIVAPPIDYSVPMMVNTWHWLFCVIMSGLLGIAACKLDLHWALKALSVGLFLSCFFSQSPYLSFNAYILVVVAIYLFVLIRWMDLKPLLSMIECAFWFQVILSAFQLAGMDKLLCFDRAFQLDPKTLQMSAFGVEYPKHVMLGTLMQYMRFSSLLAILTPFLLLKNRAYILLIGLMCVISESSGFALSLAAGAFVYFFLSADDMRRFARNVSILALLVAAYAAYDWGSFRGAILPENGGRLVSWWAVIQTWLFDTSRCLTVADLSGPFNFKWFLIGHGMDTFLPLFPIYKHDPNPFPQAHNDWLQMPWEIGIIGFGLILAYVAWLVIRLLKAGAHKHLAGLVCIGTNMCFAMPMRMTQTMFLIIAYLALCERRLRDE